MKRLATDYADYTDYEEEKRVDSRFRGNDLLRGRGSLEVESIDGLWRYVKGGGSLVSEKSRDRHHF